ncbi:MAG: hypothetical protein HUJ96_06005 [Marinilabiliaceae bacterium]|nr:hypothetical protein [Marinilabiliaceae bacterium]
MGEGYLECAFNIVDSCLIDNENRDHKADVWFFPVLFNTIHGIELYLKSIRCRLNKIEDVEKQHNIQKICNDIVEIAKKLIIMLCRQY